MSPESTNSGSPRPYGPRDDGINQHFSSLEFRESAWKEWNKLDRPLREQFKAKLLERLDNPRVESSRLSGMPDCYKIKLRAAGYRLVYQVFDERVVVVVVAVGKQEDSAVYRKAGKRLK